MITNGKEKNTISRKLVKSRKNGKEQEKKTKSKEQK